MREENSISGEDLTVWSVTKTWVRKKIKFTNAWSSKIITRSFDTKLFSWKCVDGFFHHPSFVLWMEAIDWLALTINYQSNLSLEKNAEKENKAGDPNTEYCCIIYKYN